ncbi:hypothetical protein Hanom_Chr15g01346451 [Helianthus anomalus]
MYVLNTRPCRSMTPVGEELMLLSSDGSLGFDSSAGVLVALGAHPATTEGQKAQKTKHQEKLDAPVSKQTGTGIFRPRKTPSKDYVLVFDTLEVLGILGPTTSTVGASASTVFSRRPRVVRKRKAMGTPAGVPLKKPTLHLQKTTDLDAHEAHVSAGATTVVTSMPPPPPPSPTPNMPIGNEEERIKEPEHFQVANVTDDAPSYDTEAHVDDEPMDDTMVADHIMEVHNNIIDPNKNQW